MSSCENQALEVSALQSIYCKDGEMADSKGTDHWKIWIRLDVTPALDKNDSLRKLESIQASVQFSLPHDYPEQSIPLVEVKCSNLDKSIIDAVAESLLRRAQEVQGEMMLLDLLCLAKELIEKELTELAESQENDMVRGNNYNALISVEDGAQSVEAQQFNENKTVSHNSSEKSRQMSSVEISNTNQSNNVTALLHLDHMRSKSSYSKLIKKWALELNLVGRLIFCQRLILILLQGNQKNVKEYIVRNRTTNVDVDSRGRSCKERMLSVLCEVVTWPDQEMGNFSIVEFLPEELTAFFKEQHLDKIYSDHVMHLLLGSSGSSARN